MSSSRRESRSSLGNKQNDALFEFETFKKKFLLANKHITKLNSTLSVRIEELNAQISMLYVENLRLRASEIALASQLKREREQSRKILADAEAASQTLTKHLTYLRESLHTKGDNAAPPTPPSPRARRPPMIIDPTSPQFRIARPPNVPGIYEDDEPSTSSAEEQDKLVIPARKKLKTSRLSASKLPIPARGPSPTPPPSETNKQRIDLSNVDTRIKPRKTIRRQSGILKVNAESLAPLRSGSPAFGSPIRLEAALAEAADEITIVHGGILVMEDDLVGVTKKEKRKGKSKEQGEMEGEKEILREKRKLINVEESSEISLKPKSSRNALQPIDSNVEDPMEADTQSKTPRPFLRSTSPSRDSSSPIPEQAEGTNGREKRVRKSVNYAEPKLNTKMRKPDPPTGIEPPRRKRSSAARTSTHKLSLSTAADATQVAVVDDETGAAQLSQTSQSALPLRALNGTCIDPENFPIPPSRPGSAAAMYSPGPPTRTTGSTTSSQSTTTVASSSSTSGPSNVELSHRSRLHLLVSNDDSDGADADSEYGNGSSSSSIVWSNVNVDSGRRRGLPKRTAAAAAVAALEDIRRHSMAM